MTGLKGAYDFTVKWTPWKLLNSGGRAPDGAQPAVAVAPDGSITFFEAVEKQLGLKLESGQKHPMPVWVIDHVEALVEN
jgi:uncharacterized protein (TIGR03435 family)